MIRKKAGDIMKKKIALISIATLVICFGVVWATQEKSKDSSEITLISEQRDTLKGVQSMFIQISDLKPEIEKLGLTKQQL
jgi:hypothetical protein